jgi:hypothetical protein
MVGHQEKCVVTWDQLFIESLLVHISNHHEQCNGQITWILGSPCQNGLQI